ncbi:MAG: serine hydrolase domain-containing protein [Gaiellaceae bacterium]
MLDARFCAACEDAAARWDVPALALGFLEPGARPYELFAVGCETDTRFRIASITKPLTATLALQLLDLDASTGVWPEDVKIRHLLAHTSGFECENGDLARFGDGDDALARAAAELTRVRRFLPVEQVWSYANTGYWLAGALCAEAAGEPFEDALRRRVLTPAHMDASDFGEPDQRGSGRGASDEPYPRARRPSGGVVSNVRDLLCFAEWQLGLGWTGALRVPHGKPLGGVYGLGFAGERVGGCEVWGHGGSYGGFQSALLLVPERGAAFAGLTSSGSGRQALREIEDLWFERLLDARRRVALTIELPVEALEGFCGVYADGEARVTVTVRDGGLGGVFVEDDERIEVAARPIGPRTFEIAGGDLDRDRFDFPLPGFARFGSCLAPRLE